MQRPASSSLQKAESPLRRFSGPLLILLANSSRASGNPDSPPQHASSCPASGQRPTAGIRQQYPLLLTGRAWGEGTGRRGFGAGSRRYRDSSLLTRAASSAARNISAEILRHSG